MNKLTIIGNLVRDPESRTVSGNLTVCTFTVAVNRRRSSQNSNAPEADFFRVTAWRQLGENCQTYLAKGRKVCVVGPVSVSTYTANDGTFRANLEITAEDVEFLSPRTENGSSSSPAPAAHAAPAAEDYSVVESDELPF